MRLYELSNTQSNFLSLLKKNLHRISKSSLSKTMNDVPVSITATCEPSLMSISTSEIIGTIELTSTDQYGEYVTGQVKLSAFSISCSSMPSPPMIKKSLFV